MKWRKWLENWDMTSLRIKTPVLEAEWRPQADKTAAWELYIELLTRTATQELPDAHGDDQAALKSVHSLFSLTRETIKRNGRDCTEFTKIAVVVLNQVVRPFTSKWHPFLLDGSMQRQDQRSKFRAELADLQSKLRTYTGMLSEMAGVEDLTDMETSD